MSQRFLTELPGTANSQYAPQIAVIDLQSRATRVGGRISCLSSAGPPLLQRSSLMGCIVCRSHTAEIRLIAAQRKPQIPAGYAVFSEQIKRSAGATGENGNIPTPHRRVETKLEEQPIGSSFRTFFSIQCSADWRPKPDVRERKPEVPAGYCSRNAGPAGHKARSAFNRGNDRKACAGRPATKGTKMAPSGLPRARGGPDSGPI